MNLDEIEKKCFILALFIRDDGERFLLGSRMFEFLDSQLHFSGNNYQNDIVEVQGNDGVMLAGQVRRGSSQAFDGYIGDSSVERHVIEQNRRAFFKFFRKNHYYKVVYIFTDGTAIQRRQGFIVEAPEVKELYQLFPQYHISMNFEDINYYNYEEDSEGQEIYGESATLKVITSATGGLIWEDGSQTTISGEGSSFTLQDTIDDNVLESVSIKGDTTQQTYSGKNLWELPANATSATTILTNNNDGTFNITGTANADGNFSIVVPLASSGIIAGQTYSLWSNKALGWADNAVSCFIQECTSEGYWVSNLAIFQANQSKTIPSSISTQYVKFVLVFRNGTKFDDYNNVKIQLVKGSSIDQDFEPYVGGIPAPNPDYPQTVNTVTGRQVVTISDGDSQSQSYEVNLGKNLLDPSILIQGHINGGTPTNRVCTRSGDDIYVSGGDTYTISVSDIFIQVNVYAYKSINGTAIYESGWQTMPFTFELPSQANYLRLMFRYANGSDIVPSNITCQLEKGSTATTYAPYFTPIELCKIGTYQDYIYKSGSDWYVHKEVVKISPDGTESWNSLSISNPNYIYCYTSAFDSQVKPKVWDGLLSDKFIVYDHSDGTYNWLSPSATIKYPCFSNGDNSETINLRIMCPKTTASSLANFKTWLGTNRPVFYYPINGATDTQITNADLIAQLEALAGATTYDGQTVFTVSSPNQLAILNVSVIAITNGGVVWDNYGAEWEEGTGGGPTMVNIDSIDNVYPVWELTGPAVNPQISVLNTNTILSYTGTVTASQTLKIDMFNKTATLNGASVIGNVSGDWVYLEPGINRLTYTTSNADAPDSTIWWQEIVG